jgi:hypothetical protein
MPNISISVRSIRKRVAGYGPNSRARHVTKETNFRFPWRKVFRRRVAHLRAYDILKVFAFEVLAHVIPPVRILVALCSPR